MKLARESWVLAAICMVDLMTTIHFVHHRGAIEGNPVMAYFLTFGVCAFVAAKLVLFMGPLAIIEWARQQRPLFATGMLRLVVVLYVSFYGIGVWRLNHSEELEMTPAQLAAVERTVAIPPTAEEIRAFRERMQSN